MQQIDSIFCTSVIPDYQRFWDCFMGRKNRLGAIAQSRVLTDRPGTVNGRVTECMLIVRSSSFRTRRKSLAQGGTPATDPRACEQVAYLWAIFTSRSSKQIVRQHSSTPCFPAIPHRIWSQSSECNGLGVLLMAWTSNGKDPSGAAQEVHR